MNNPLHAKYLADHACQRQVTVVENVRLARDTYRVRFHAPEIARSITPGQFLMLRIADGNDPLLGRPLALYDTLLDTSGQPLGVDVVYLVVGKLTNRLATFTAGQTLDVWGPLGNGFPLQETEHLVMVAGGIGQTPFLALAREYLGLRHYGSRQANASNPRRVTFCYGARSEAYFAGLDDFSALGIDIRLSTDDGSRGYHGLVTQVARGVLSESPNCRVVCCGPERMMEAVSELAAEHHVPCQVSLETPMACGIGICFSCVAKVADDAGGWDYKRTCVEGPIFPAEKIVW